MEIKTPDRGEAVVSELAVLFRDLSRVESDLRIVVDARLRADCDLRLSWFEPIQVISSAGACRVRDIAEALSITMGGTSKLVDRLEAAGLCRRRPNPTDRRSSVIGLTASGRRRHTRAERVVEDELRRRLGSSVSPAALARLGGTLRTLRAAIGRPSER